MTSVQTKIPFTHRKRTTRSGKIELKCDKENDSQIINKTPTKIKSNEEIKSPTNGKKRLSLEGRNIFDCSPPKQSKSPAKTQSPSTLLGKIDLNSENKKPDVHGKELSTAIRALHTAQPCTLPGREDKINGITDILLDCLENNKSTTLYISGQPGTGKTACLNYLTSQPEITSGFKIVYVNCTGIKSSTAIYKRIGEELSLKIKGTKEKLSEETILKYLLSPHKMILLVLDEMDQLESKNQSILYTIFEWPSLPKSNIVLIGIANALDLTDRVLPRLQARLELKPTLIYFTPYNKDEIIKIITHRLNEAGVSNILPEGALQLLASKVASVSGDIRRALDVARRVIELAQMNDQNGKVVSFKDVLTVVNNVYNTTSSLQTNEDNSESFPLQQKILICTTVLIRQHSKSKELSIGKLHDVYKKICEKRNMSSLDMSEFLSLAQLVESRGIIKIQGKNKNRLSKVTLQWDESEISNALKDKQLLSTIVADVSCL